MNGNNHNNNLLCNQMSKNLPLKKRRVYLIDSPVTNHEQDENSSKIIKPSSSPDDSFSSSIPIVPTPPSSPHVEFLRQQYAYLSGNSANIQQQNYNYLLAQQYRFFLEQQQKYSYTIVEDKQKRTDSTIDEHFRKSLGENYDQFTDRCFTPDDSSSNSSSTERTSVDSIEEHFARSLAKFWPLNEPETSSIHHQITGAVVDDHFAKALGSTTWEKFREKS